MKSVPFTMRNLYAGFAQCEGLLRADKSHLCLEFEVKDTVIRAIKSDVKLVQISWSDVASLTHEKSWWGILGADSKIVIQANRLDILREVPSASQGRVELRIARKDLDTADELVAHAQIPGEKPLPPFQP